VKYRTQAHPRKRNEHIHSHVHRFTLESESEEERSYLCWVSRLVLSGDLRERYIDEMAKNPDVLADLSGHDLITARKVFFAGHGEDGIDMSFERMLPLQEKGWIRELERLPGRGRYAGRFTYFPTDKLAIIVRAAHNKENTHG
jgi:hypothetical protein